MRVIYLLPLFSVSIFAHSNNNILHFHFIEYFIYAVAGIATLSILGIFYLLGFSVFFLLKGF